MGMLPKCILSPYLVVIQLWGYGPCNVLKSARDYVESAKLLQFPLIHIWGRKPSNVFPLSKNTANSKMILFFSDLSKIVAFENMLAPCPQRLEDLINKQAIEKILLS